MKKLITSQWYETKWGFLLKRLDTIGYKIKGDRFKKTTFSDESLGLFLYIS